MSLHQSPLSDSDLLRGLHAFRDILELTQNDVINILEGEPTVPLSQTVRKKIRDILRIVYLQDLGWNYASYPHVRPSFALSMKTWFETPQPELGSSTPIDLLKKNSAQAIDQLLASLGTFQQISEIPSLSGRYRSLGSGDEIEYQ